MPKKVAPKSENRHDYKKCHLCPHEEKHGKKALHKTWHKKQAAKEFLCFNCPKGFTLFKELNRHHKAVHKRSSGKGAHNPNDTKVSKFWRKKAPTNASMLGDQPIDRRDLLSSIDTL